jgi:hypothetical protein
MSVTQLWWVARTSLAAQIIMSDYALDIFYLQQVDAKHSMILRTGIVEAKLWAL